MEAARLCTSCRHVVLKRYLRKLKCFKERRAPHHTRPLTPRHNRDGLVSLVTVDVSKLPRPTVARELNSPIRRTASSFARHFNPTDGSPLLGDTKQTGSLRSPSALRNDILSSRQLHLPSSDEVPSVRNASSELSSEQARPSIRRIIATKPPDRLDRLESIFADITHQSQPGSDVEPGAGSTWKELATTNQERAKMAETYISKMTSYSSWDYVRSLIHENPKSADHISFRTWDKATLDFTRQWCSDTVDTMMDSPLTVIQSAVRYSKRFEIIHFSLWRLIAHAAAKLQEIEDSIMSGQTLSSFDRSFSETVDELLSLWELILNLGHQKRHSSVEEMTGNLSKNEKKVRRLLNYGYVSHLDHISNVKNKLGVHSTFRHRFRYFYPALSDSDMGTLPEAAVAAFLIFRRVVFSPNRFSTLWTGSTEGPKRSIHFVNFITRILPLNSDVEACLRLRKDVDHAFVPHAYDERHVQHVISLLQTNSDAVERDSIDVEFAHALKAVTASRDNAKLDYIWERVKRRVLETKLPGRAIEQPRIFSAVIRTAFAINRQSKAIEVWNFMLENDTTPTVIHWNSMIQGFGERRDHRAVEELWERMKDAGVKPDAYVWATRIRALGKSRRADLSLQAFRSMIAIWLEEVKKQDVLRTDDDLVALEDVNGCPKPDIVCLNALIASLAETRKSPFEEITELLSYAKVLGIRADAFTFNPLVLVAARQDDMELARELVEQMQAQGIQPDSITFSILLRYAFEALPPSTSEISDETGINIDIDTRRSPSLQSPHESTAASPADSASAPEAEHDMLDSAHASAASLVSTRSFETAAEILDRMHAANIPRHTHVYQTLILGLVGASPLDSHSPSADSGLRAAFALLQYMFKHAIRRNDIIYAQLVTALLPSPTSLVSSKYPAGSRLATTPTRSSLAPNFASLKRVWRIALDDSSTPLRTYFWSILVASLANADALGLAHTAIEQATQRSQVLNWEANLALLRALHRAHEYDAAAQLVQRVCAEQRRYKGEALGMKFRREFWALAQSLHLQTDFEVLEDKPEEEGNDEKIIESLNTLGVSVQRVQGQKPGEKTWHSAKGFGGEPNAALTE